ncbi:MAG: divergent polysaccharide deacetylase family protein [Parvularculaceae bacterium]|nr:divergent polysaccharide deacetylase family protein [Parvularculaceae bacterium]
MSRARRAAGTIVVRIGGRRLKLPVVSRLTQAWLAFGAVCAGLSVYTVSDTARRQAAIAMTVEGIEKIAAPEMRTAAASRIERQDFRRDAAGATSASADPYDVEAEDALAGIEAGAPVLSDPAADIVITVDGAPARSIAASPSLASLTLARIADPDPALLFRTAYGKAPRVGPDGRRAARTYARPFSPGENPNVALIVGGLGLNRALTERAIEELPPSVTLAFAPYAKDLDVWARRARETGHEFMIELPLENRRGEGETLGPATLLTTHSREQNLQRLDWILSRAEGYFGVTNYLGAHFTADRDAIEPVLARLADAGVAYVDDTGALKREKSASVATVSRLIDPGFGAEKTRTLRDLEGLEAVASRAGEALGKTYVNADTLSAVVEWAEGLGGRGLTLAPASAVLAMSAQES